MKGFWKSWKIDLVIGSIIFFLGLFLRIINLNSIPVFGDEAIYIRWSQVMRAEPTLRFLPLSDGKQPLFMWIVILFFKLFSDPVISGRMVSVLTGLGTLVGVFVLTQLLFQSKKTSFIASTVYAISPFTVFFDRLALADSMLSMFGIWVLIFSVVTVKKMRLDTAILTGFSLGGAFLTKSPATFFAGLIPFSLLLHKWPKGIREKFNRASVFLFLFTFTYLIAFGLYNILRLGPNFHMIAERNKDYVYPLKHFFESPLDPLTPFLDRILEYLRILGPSILVVLVFTGTYFGLKTKVRETLLLLFWGLIPILVISELSKTMTARYVAFSLPYLFIIASATFMNKINGLKKFVNILFIVFVFQSLVIDMKMLKDPQSVHLPRSERSGYLEEWTSGYGIKEIAEEIRNVYNGNPAQKIVVGTEGYFGTLPDGLQIYLNDLPEITVIGVGLPIGQIPNQLTESKNAGNRTYLVVNNSRFFGDYEDPQLNLLSVYPKATRPDGSREALLLFEITETPN